jgi:hypothetical protein
MNLPDIEKSGRLGRALADSSARVSAAFIPGGTDAFSRLRPKDYWPLKSVQSWS